MSSAFGAFAGVSQFYLYGKKHFTQTGWQRHQKAYDQPDLLEQTMDLSDKVYMITGANSGVGKEVAKFLACRGASVYMVCRNPVKAEAARAELAATAAATELGKRARLEVLQCDVSLEADVRRCWQEFQYASGGAQLDGLVCNAGAMAREKTLTSEGVEVTFASHLLFGTFLLGKLAMQVLEATPGSRLLIVTSGGMYTVPFPDWEIATSTSQDPKVKYDGQFAYAYAKRGQVLLAERWAESHTAVKVVTCHPGWTDTDAVDEAYGDGKNVLKPLRSKWEGAEGIAWLCVAPWNNIESGALYLDRSPQVKHMAGPFFTEGSYTKNSRHSVDAMLQKLDDWSSGRRPEDLPLKAEAFEAGARAREQGRLEAMTRPISIKEFMGRWFVVANIPTFFDKGTINNVEEYSCDEEGKNVTVNFLYSSQDSATKGCIRQRAVVNDPIQGTEWKLTPEFGIPLPVSLPYLIVDCAEDYSSCIIGMPKRQHVWIMTRDPNPDERVVEELIRKAQAFGYDVTKVQRVKQDWKNDLPASDCPTSATTC